MAEHFNYVSFGNRDDVEGDIQEIIMTRGRMFEYTPPDLASALEPLGTDALEFIDELPTFLCTEYMRGETGGSMIVKLGDISNTRVRGREVVADFETLVDFGEVPFSSIDQAREAFGAEGYQLYRTHWAIRFGEIEPILQRLAKLKPEYKLDSSVLEKPEQTPPPPKHEKRIAGTASSVEQFLKILENWSATETTETFFRGHEDESFELTPSILRKSKAGAWQFFPKEERLCKELLIAHYDEFQGDQYCFDRLVRMQHYSLPTRLLDISSNPLVALFFACYCNSDIIDKPGEVIILRIKSNAIKYYDSDTVSCLANLSNLTYTQKNEIDLTLDEREFNKTDVIEKLIHHIRSEKGFFEGRISPDDLGSVICVKAKRTNTRIKSQSGAFLLFGHETSLPEEGQDSIEIARITVTDKRAILRQLDAININATTVYPSISETAVHLKQRYRDTNSADSN